MKLPPLEVAGGGRVLWSIEEEPKHVHLSVVSSLADSHRSGGREKVGGGGSGKPRILL